MALYDEIGKHYSDYRKPDPRIAAIIGRAVNGARRVVNVGAGTGSYEPADRMVIAVEPSRIMIEQQPPHAAPVVRASAMQLPFADDSFDAALALLTVHHWADQERGLREMARVARRSVIFTWDETEADVWLTRDYFPQVGAQGRAICPRLEMFRRVFGRLTILPVPIAHDCSDGFLQAYWRRPEAYFDPGARRAISAFAHVSGVEAGLERLRRDLDDGTWLVRNGHLLTRDELDLGYRVIIGERGPRDADAA